MQRRFASPRPPGCARRLGPRPGRRLRRCGRRSPRRPLRRASAGRVRSSAGSRSRARMSGSVTVPSRRSVPRALPVRSGGPATSRTSSRSWNASPISWPNERSACGCGIAVARDAADQASALEEARRLQAAALEVALGGGVDVPSVAALRELAEREADGGAGEKLDLALSAFAATLAQLGERAGEQEVADRGGALAARGGHHGRQAAAKRRLVEDVVVDEGRHVDELDRRGAAKRRRLGLGPRAEQHEHRAQALAAGLERRARVAAELVAVALDQLAEPLLDRRHQGGEPGLGLVHHLGDGRRHCGAVHGVASGRAHARVDRDDAAGQDRVADLGRARPRPSAGRALRGAGSRAPTRAGTSRPRGRPRCGRARARCGRTRCRRRSRAAAFAAG